MRGAEVEHLLGFGDAADLGAREGLAAVDEGAQRQGDGLSGQAHVDEDAVGAQGGHVAGVVEAVGGHGAQDQVEGPPQGLEHALLAGRVEVVGAEAAGVGLLGAAVGDDGDVGAHGLGDLHAHVSEAAHAEDGHARAGAHVVVLEGRVCGDAGTQEGRAGGEVEGFRHVQGEVLAHGEAARVSAGRRVTFGIGAVGPQGAGRRGAPLLVVGFAHLARAAGADHAAHAHAVPHLERGDAGADLGDGADELVAGHERVRHGTPLAAGGVDVGVADARVGDVEVDLPLAGFTDIDLQGVELGGCIVASIGDHAGHDNSFVRSIGLLQAYCINKNPGA